MPSIERRKFLQFLGAAGVVPVLPALPVKTLVPASGPSVSKALWAGIYAKSGSASQFVGVAQNMGLSNAAIRGVGARSLGVKLAVGAAAQPLSGIDVARRVPSEAREASGDVLREFERCLMDEPEEDVSLDDQVSCEGLES